MKIVSASEMKEIDRITTDKFAVPSLTLMENAGTAVAEFVLREFPHCERIGVICGRGNNGGDGFVAARKLHQAGKHVNVFRLAEPESVKGDAAAMLARLPVRTVPVLSAAVLGKIDLSEYDLIVDAILGTGFRPPVAGIYSAAIQAINASGAAVVAVDIPSGADADALEPAKTEMVCAHAIVTFTALKPAHVFQFDDVPTAVRPIGSPPEAVQSSLNLRHITPADFAKLLVPRPRSAHKGDFGHVLVIGGSLGKAGAPAMAGMAALRGGAGLVTVAAPKSILPTVAGFAPELMTHPLDESRAGAISDSITNLPLEGKNVVAIGPGLSREAEAAEFARAAVMNTALPIVLDADGLNAFEGMADKLNGAKRTLVLTPHPGEMGRLTGCSTSAVQEDRIGIARRFAQERHCYVVLKGQRTLVAEPDGKVWVNTTGNPGMATGGTGDILTGILVSLMAQHPEEISLAIIAAVHIHGLAGDIAREEAGEISLMATDLLMALPRAFRQLTGGITSKQQ